jgi:hypothetical protein
MLEFRRKQSMLATLRDLSSPKVPCSEGNSRIGQFVILRRCAVTPGERAISEFLWLQSEIPRVGYSAARFLSVSRRMEALWGRRGGRDEASERWALEESPVAGCYAGGEELRGESPSSSFARMCARLGIELIGASSPQEKGRVERMHGFDFPQLNAEAAGFGLVIEPAKVLEGAVRQISG